MVPPRDARGRFRSSRWFPSGWWPLGLLLALIVVSLAVSMVQCSPAHAADAVIAAVPTASQVWFGNALQAVLMACAAPVAAILCKLLWMAAAKIGVQASAEDMAKMEAEAKAALTVGAVKSTDLIAQRGWDHADVKNAVLADALNYFLERFPDRSTAIAAQAGVAAPEVASPAKDTAVKETLMARLPDAMNEAAASVATPPAPVTPAVVVNIPPAVPVP